jgi:hypothetical protein
MRRGKGAPRAPPSRVICSAVARPTRFESYRYLGDKRTQVVYDLDLVDDAGLQPVIDELMASEKFAAFSPDTLAEARNRGYRPHRSVDEAAGAAP